MRSHCKSSYCRFKPVSPEGPRDGEGRGDVGAEGCGIDAGPTVEGDTGDETGIGGLRDGAATEAGGVLGGGALSRATGAGGVPTLGVGDAGLL